MATTVDTSTNCAATSSTRTTKWATSLIADASSSTSSSTSALLAKKALKHRKVYDCMTGVDMKDPNFDVFKFLEVDC
ncbi:hypothetical protein GN244_ATG09341 [Phytophthora infestans]|uniref:Uncharacterized protein n=1 Tax=Phytophthora infestans TaxID=4787 RepID=A0A833SV17_PHYIN|nr:hypothetical protein GN244_ATG09341 [Phytophthora infestans]